MNIWHNHNLAIFDRLPFIFFVVLALLAGIAYGLTLEGVFGHIWYYVALGIICISVMAIIIMLRQDELAANVIMAINLCVDWYLGYSIISIVMAALLLLIFFFARSPQRPWAKPRALWLWVLFLGMTISPAIQGALISYDALYYYPELICGALVMFWLGTVIARDFASMRRFFQILAIFATLIAMHSIIESVTGHYLLLTTNVEVYLANRSGYQLGASGVSRLASFFIQPDAGGAFFAFMVFIPLGLFVESHSLWKKVFHLIETLLILLALLLTYSGGSVVAVCIGVIVFLVFVGSTLYRIELLLLISAAAAVLFLGFPSQIDLLLQHTSNPAELSLRNGLWQTAWRIIQAFPLTGIGLGRLVYLQQSGPYGAPMSIPENNPHNSYLEIGAMAGLPTLCVFLALLLFALWTALCHWKRVKGSMRPLLAAGIAAIIALSCNSWSFGVWTLPPLACCGWMLLGVISSPLLARSVAAQMTKEG